MSGYVIFKDGEDTVFTAGGEEITRGSASQTLQTAINMTAFINRWYEPKKPWYSHLWDAVRRKKNSPTLIEQRAGKFTLDKPITLSDNIHLQGDNRDEVEIG